MSIQPIKSGVPSLNFEKPQKSGESNGFGEALTDAAKEVSKLEHEANALAQKIAAGEVDDLHHAMLSMQKASMAMELTVQVRNKVLEAYQEIMRMQI